MTGKATILKNTLAEAQWIAGHGKKCRVLAKLVYLGRIADPTKGSDHYHAETIQKPYWTKSMKRMLTIDGHVFYAGT